jgi:hypothetical protein
MNFGLWLGDGEPVGDNVVVMPEVVFKALPESVWQDHTFDDLPTPIRQLAWDILGREGPIPRMRLVVSAKALERAVERVKQKQVPLVVTVQARLDGYQTDKQRRQRLRELDRQNRDNGGYSAIGDTIERFALWYRLKQHRIVTAKELEEVVYNGAIGGTLPLSISVDGQRLTVPQDVIRRSIRH